MILDLVLATLHHIAAFGLVALLMAEGVLLRPGIAGRDLQRVARLDAAYGATAGLVLVAGALRVAFAAKGWAYYQDNPWFWAKMASFGLIGALSIPPTIRFLRWRRLARVDAAFAPPDAEIATARRFVRLQSLLVVLVLVFAAAMARFA